MSHLAERRPALRTPGGRRATSARSPTRPPIHVPARNTGAAAPTWTTMTRAGAARPTRGHRPAARPCGATRFAAVTTGDVAEIWREYAEKVPGPATSRTADHFLAEETPAKPPLPCRDSPGLKSRSRVIRTRGVASPCGILLPGMAIQPVAHRVASAGAGGARAPDSRLPRERHPGGPDGTRAPPGSRRAPPPRRSVTGSRRARWPARRRPHGDRNGRPPGRFGWGRRASVNSVAEQRDPAGAHEGGVPASSISQQWSCAAGATAERTGPQRNQDAERHSSSSA